MPVPVASTHANGKGLEAAKFSQMETEGPFARLKSSGPAAAASEPAAQTARATEAADPAAAQSQPPDEHSVPAFALETHDLSFKYPGIGASNSSRLCLITRLVLPTSNRTCSTFGLMCS